ncbi:MAG: argininosuccinate lyase [Syntrophorhabdaceae bacterium]|nr:argininosuccinate lyase [Syntrophorhabdaceae bacterium]
MKAWSGRFKQKTHPLMERFSASIDFDKRLYRYDIEGSIAHAEMLKRIGILSDLELKEIVKGLKEIGEEIERGEFPFSDAREDIHMHIEGRLIEKIGDGGRKLHTGRSRNDQVSLDVRLYLKAELATIDKRLLNLLKALLIRAEKEKKTMMAGYTHLQKAQVVPFAHYLMAYYQMFKRDRERLKKTLDIIDVLPLGSGAIAGSTIPLDREYVRRRLNFSRLSENSMDAISDRDFLIETVFSMAMIMMHLSRLAEDFILYSTEEFSYISLPDELCTGSSLMPHKKNPDGLELIRGKASRVIGDLVSVLVMMKGLPMTYNRDLQEDKEPLFHALDTVGDSISIAELCVKKMKVNRKRMEESVEESFMPAVEMAEYLTIKGMPFREAHEITGKIVRVCEEEGIRLRNLELKRLKEYSGLFEEDVFEYMEPSKILARRRTYGGASFEEVEREIEREKSYCNS